MKSPLVPVKIPPGVYREGTKYQSQRRWYDANLVRFENGTVGPVGGWRRLQDENLADFAAFAGVPRAMLTWSRDNGEGNLAVATTEKLYLIQGGGLNDITPADFTVGQEDSNPVGGVGTYGSGNYGAGPYGSGSLLGVRTDADTWQLDAFGQDLVGVCTSDEKLYRWDGSDINTAAVAVVGAPSARGVVVTPERFVVLLGADDDARQIKWPSREDTADWESTAANTAGDLKLATNGRLLSGRRTRGETLLWTDVDVHVLTYIGGELVYAVAQAGDQCGLIAPNAAVTIDTQAVWMGRKAFYRYDGFVHPVPCEVSDYVFGDMNREQAAKIWAMSLAHHGEVWWFYPSGSANEIDRYVCFNYRENHWTIGKLSRTAGAPSGALPDPILSDADGFIYEHEVGSDRGDEVPYLESGPVEIGNGDRVSKVHRIVPDENNIGDVKVTIYGATSPTGTETEYEPAVVAQPTDIRVTARQIRLRIEQAREVNWRVGMYRLAVRPGGKR